MKTQLNLGKQICLLLLLFSPAINAQWQDGLWVGKHTDNWIMSFNGVNFATGEPILVPGVNFNVLEGSATISDAAGDLLFYAGNQEVRNSNFQLMLNGGGLISGGSSSTQSGVIIPKPGSSTIYYLFNVDNAYTESPGLTYSEIDMTLDGGLGGVTTNKNIVLNAAAKVEKITSVHHQDGLRYWVITHLMESNSFVAYLVSADGVNTTPVVSSLGNFYPGQADPNDFNLGPEGVGQLKASPDGTKLASVMIDGPSKGLELFDFNNATGEITNPKYIGGFTQMTYGVEFSPNSKFVYVANSMGLVLAGSIHQFDATKTTAAEIIASEVIIADIPFNGTLGFSAMQLAPNGRIYIADVINGALNAIPNPNNQGMAAGFTPGAFDPPQGGGIGLPSFNQSFLGSGILAEEPCPGSVTFSLLRIPDVTSVAWNFGDPASGDANTSSIAEHTFSAAGTYTVTAVISSNGGTQTATTQVTVSAPAGITNPSDLSQCADLSGSATFDLTQQTAAILGASNPADFTIEYFASQTDADNGANAITTATATSSVPTIIFVKVTTVATGCSSTLTFNITADAPPTPGTTIALTSCDTANIDGFGTFNLSAQNTAILNGQAGTVSYFLTQADAEANTNPIADAAEFTSTANPQTVFARITSDAGCVATTSFQLSVTQSNLLDDELELQGCSPLDLTQLSGLVDAGLQLSFYASQADANSGENAISQPNGYAFSESERIIFVRGENAEGCADVAELTLIREKCEIQKGISANGDNVNDTFDLSSYEVSKLQIFNRYGTKVYSKSNYTNQFSGLADNGNELPDGTYYYVIDFNNTDSKTGWIYINRKY